MSQSFLTFYSFLRNCQVDCTIPEVLEEYTQYFYMATAGVFIMYAICYLIIIMKKETTSVWMPPPKTPATPFSSEQPKAPTLMEYQQTTIQAHELGLLKSAAGQTLFGAGMAMVMSWKFNIHMSIVMNIGMFPYSLFDCLATRRTLMLHKLPFCGGDQIYTVLTEKPAGWKPAADKKED
jgi:hypothetical protein